MSKFRFVGCLVLFLVLVRISSLSAATLYTYTNGGSTGLWATATTWTTDPTGATLVGSAVPGNNDVVYILNGYTVTLDANVNASNLTIVIVNGGTLDLSTFTFTTAIYNLAGSGTLRIKSGYFPATTVNSFLASYASGATVHYFDFAGILPPSINYPNLTISNSTASNNIIRFDNTTAYSFTIYGNLVTQNTGIGSLTLTMGTQATNVLSLAVNGNVTFGSGTTFNTGAFNAIHTISLSGNMTNNGNVSLSNTTQYLTSTTGAANVTFTGSTNNTLACNGVTNFYGLTVDKGSSSTYVLSVTSTNIANLNFYTSGKLYSVVNGTLRLGANISITKAFGSGTANYDVGSSTNSPMLWIDGATVNSGGSALVIYGKFRITAGSYTTMGGEGSVIREEGQYLIEGGTFTTEKFRPSTTATTHRGSFTMTGGTVNASGTTNSNNGYARFSLPFPEQVFIMSGGTINVSNPEPGGGATNGGIHIGCNVSNYNVTGGTINAILSGTAAVFYVASTAPFYNFNITRTGGTPTTVLLNGIGSIGGSTTTTQPLVVLNAFLIDGTNSPIFDSNTRSVTIGGAFTINSGGTYIPNGNTTFFNGASDQNFNNSGTITSGLYNLTVTKSGGALILGGSATTYTVARNLTLLSGIFNDGGKTVNVAGNIYTESIHTGTGNITLNGTTTQTISGDGNGIFGNLILNNTSTPGALLTADLAISGVLTLAGTTNSLFDIQLYLLSLTSTSSTAITTTGNTFSSAKMIRTLGFQSDRGVKKTFGNLSSFTYPFGVGSNYTPATLQLTSAPTTYGTITARPVNSRHQLTKALNTNNLTYYWKVESAGFTGVSATAVSHSYHYIEANVAPAGDDANYIPARYNPTVWTTINNVTQVDDTNNIIYFTGVGYIDGEFTAGVPAAFDIVKIFYSKRNGNWSDTSPTTTPWSNVSHNGPDATTSPTAGDQVYIGDGVSNNHVIIISANGQRAGGLEINAGSTLDVGVHTGHNFGTFTNAPISGSGLLRISSASATAEFPAGDFGNFIRASGGTVEYYSTGSQDFTIPVSSASPTILPLISYKNLLLSPATGRYIALPNQDERIYNNLIIQGTSTTAVARINAGSAKTLLINNDLVVNSGNFQFQNGTAQSVTVDNNVTISSGATFGLVVANAIAANTLSIEGSLVNNGTFDMANGAYYCNTTFIGTTNTSITGTGATTDFNILTVSKGTSQIPVLNVNATAFTLSSATTPLVLLNGTFRLSSTQTVTIANGADFNIPSTAKLSANGGTIQTTGVDGHDLLLAGTLEVLNGGVTIGTSTNDNSIEYAATGQPTISVAGGTLNIRSQVRRSTASSQGGLIYSQSGGTIAVGLTNAASTTRGVFEILNPGSVFTMSGGTLVISRGSGSTSISDLYLQPSSYTVTGGTIEIGTGVTSQAVDINTIIPLYNLSVTGTTNVAKLEFNGVTLRGTLDIGSTNIFNANSLNVNIAGNFVNANALNTTGVTVGGYQAGNTLQTTTFNSSTGNQTLTGVSGNVSNFANLVINNTFTGGVVTLQSNTNLHVNSTLTLANGTLAGGANTITAVSTVSNSATHTSTGAGSITLAGTSSQVVTGNGSGKFGNLVLNNGSGAVFGASQEVTNILTLTSGLLYIGANTLTLSNTSLSSIVGASSARYIVSSGLLSDGGVVKAFAGSLTGANFNFPIGVSGKYTPADYTITTGTTGGRVTIKPVNSKHPSATGPGTSYVNYYWSVSHTITNLTALTHRYTYVAVDEVGIPADYFNARFNGGAWTIGVTVGNPNTTTRVITFTNVLELTGDYTAGEPTAFVNPTTYISNASGNWESDATWNVDPPGAGIGPPAGSFVIIRVGDVVTMTTNAKAMATVEVRGQLNLGTTTGHDFGTVSTSGGGLRTIQLKSSTFPTGDFSTFTAAGGGTIDYDGVVTLPTQAIYNNISFSSVGTKTMPNVDLTVNGNFTINGGTVSNAVSNRNITLTNTTGDFINNGTFIAGNGAIVIGRNLTNTGSASFIAGNGSDGLKVFGNFTNNASATYISGADSLGVSGNFTNSSTFNAGTGPIRVSGNLNNTAGTFTANSGTVLVKGSFTNNAVYVASSGATTVRGSYTNSGAAAVFQANANVLTINGNFINSVTANFNANTGSIILNGNWTNSATFNAGTGSVSFGNTGTQTLTGSTSFNNLNRNNGGALTLNNSISIAGLLALNNGKIVTGSNVVTLTNTAVQPVSGYSTTNFIDGRLSISYPSTAGTSRFFPIGKGSIYRPVAIQQNAASTSPVVSLEMINTPPSGTFPSSIAGLSEARYFSVDLISGAMNSPTVELNFNTNGAPDESITVPGNVHIVRATSSTGPWTDEGGAGVFSPAAPAGYATSGITSLSNPTFFALAYQSTPLPITLKSFEAALRNGVVELNWITYSEINNAFFTIERSSDGFNFERVASVEGAGNSKTTLKYQTVDAHPLAGVSYYRLKQTDFDGKFTVSKPVKIYNENNDDDTTMLMVYPNPSTLSVPVSLKLESKTNRYTTGQLLITNVKGIILYSGTVDLSSEVSLQALGLKFTLEPGVYILNFISGDFHSVRKFIIF